MKDIVNRELMSKLYRMMEKYEVCPKFEWLEEALDYWDKINKEMESLSKEYQNNEFGYRLILGLWLAFEDRYKAVNGQLPSKNGAPVQQKLFE